MNRVFFDKIKYFFKHAFNPKAFGFYGGGIASYFAGVILAGRETDQTGIIPSIIFNFGDWQIHLHHWLTSLILMAFLFVPLFLKNKISKKIFLFIFGCCLGLTAQGIFCYSDWNQVLIKQN
jgi:hypothetical protein